MGQRMAVTITAAATCTDARAAASSSPGTTPATMVGVATALPATDARDAPA